MQATRNHMICIFTIQLLGYIIAMDSQELCWARQIAGGKMNWKTEMANQMENEMENHRQPIAEHAKRA